MEFKVLSLEDCERVRIWRNDCLEALRTPYPLTEEQQEEFYINVVCDRNANSRYWGIWEESRKGMYYPYDKEPKIVRENALIGMAGIENIERENGRGEISLILNPEYRGKGHGEKALEILLKKGYDELNLHSIWGLCYECNPATSFWEREINRYKAFNTIIPNMKYWNGKYWKGLYFSFGW